MKTDLSVIESVPSILVWYGSVDEDILFDCLYGIEEEGIPYRIEKKLGSSTVDQAFEASCASLLEVGIALNEDSIAVHYSRLPKECPMFMVEKQINKSLVRRLGCNAARMVKGIPFVLEEV